MVSWPLPGLSLPRTAPPVPPPVNTPRQPAVKPVPTRGSKPIERPAAPPDTAGQKGSGTAPSEQQGLSLSVYVGYKHLPPDGEIAAAEDLACDPDMRNCKTLIYTYEQKCSTCSGTGFSRGHAGGRRGGRGHGSGRASLCTCLMCHGIGYVRRTTSRFTPETGPGSDTLTIGRPPPSETPPKKRQPPKI